MHVCMLSSERFPPNERIEREAKALREAGHAVTVVARGESDDSDHEIVEGIDIRRIIDDSLYSGFRGKLDGARYAFQFVQPAWIRAVSEVDDERAIDVCCVQDLSLTKTGRRIGEKLDVPVVCDRPGNPTARAAAESRGGQFRGLARRVFHSPWRLGRLESNLSDVDQLVTTCEEARARYVREVGIDSRRVAVVRDTADPSISIETDHRARGLGFDPEEAFVVTIVADSDSDELETFVEATARAADSAADLRVVLVGDLDEDTLSDLETLARRRLAGGRVTFRTETHRTTEYVAMSDVCVFPRASWTEEMTVPVEVFEAMALGVPVVSDATPVSRVVTQTNAGYVVPSGESDALTDALVALSDPELAAEFGANGRSAVKREFDWERDADRLREVYESLLEEPPAEEIIQIDKQPL